MKKNVVTLFVSILTFLIFSIHSSGQVQNKDLNLMPMPESVNVISGKFRLDKSFVIGLTNHNDGLFKSAQRTLKILTDRTGLFLNEQFPHRDNLEAANVLIEVEKDENLKLGIDESYDLTIAEEVIRLKARTSVGAMHGLSTLVQLLDTDEDGYYFPCISIKDKPRFVWRGLLIDVSRHFMPIDVIKRNLDAMAALKMNVFHWHLTDDHGFRVESKTFPKLHELGSDGLYYTYEQIKDIVRFSAERGIRVVPEFDLPGHATSWLVGYPELASAPGPYSIERKWGIFDPTFDPTNEYTYKFLEEFFKEMSTLFPDNYWHIGGDENNGKQWDANPKIQEFMKKNNLKSNHALQNYFNIRLGEILSKLNKTMVGWYTDEMPDLSKDYIVQAWKGRASLYETAKNGYRSLLSHGFYIDLVQATDYHYLNDPIPPDSVLTEDVKQKILGGEATMWAEFVGPETIDSRIWPRTAAIAERLWSPSSVNDVQNMYERLDKVSLQLETYGLAHIKNNEMMLRRIVGSCDIGTLKTFVDVVKPLYTYSRDRPHVFKSYYPLTRIVDVSVPDPKVARIFDNNVSKFLEGTIVDEKNILELTKLLTQWRDNHSKLISVINKAPILKEVETLSDDLSKCADICLEAINLIQNKKKADNGWLSASIDALNKAKTPRGETELAVLKSMEKLIYRCK